MADSVKTMSDEEARRSIEESLRRILAAQTSMFATVLTNKNEFTPDGALTLEEVTNELQESLTLPAKVAGGVRTSVRRRKQQRRRSTRKFRK